MIFMHILRDPPAIAAPTKQDGFGAFTGREAEPSVQIGFRQKEAELIGIERASQLDPGERDG
jgi:hypothetical protein